jgi:capsule polysaccharide export protein KpsE/RkpR
MKENAAKLMAEEDVHVLEYILVILKHKEFIIKITIGAMTAAALISLLIPPTYLAETKILPPQSGNSSMASLMASQMGLPSAVLGVKTTNDLYIALLRTRAVADYVIDNQNLILTFKAKSRESIRRILEANLVTRDDKKSGIVVVGFHHSNPQKAADIANAFVAGLQNLNNNLAVTEASQRRLFFEEQLRNAKENLIKSEENLKYFQQRTGTIKIDDEAKAVIGTVAEMRAKISAKEVQLRVMRSYATPENPDLLRLQDETAALKEELRKMESKTLGGDDAVFNVSKISSLGTEYIRRMREYKYNEALYEILIKQFEAAKLDESKDAALLQIIERAEAPEVRVKPDRRKIVVRTGVLFLVFSILGVLVRSYYHSYISDPLNQTLIENLKTCLTFDQLKKDLNMDSVVNGFFKLFHRR